MDATEACPGAGLPRPSEFDFMFTDEGWALLSEETRRSIIGVLDEDREEKTRLQERRQSRSRKDRRKDPRPDKQIQPSKSLDPNLSRDNGGYLSLSYPARGISAMGCLIEIDIKIKGKDVDKDLSIIDGSVKAFGQFDSRTANHVDNVNGKIIFKTYVVRKGVEATIDLEFVEVPIGGFNVRMRGKTVRGKAVYSFITECCDDDSFIASPGKHNKKFVAAVSIGDTLCVDFMEKRREALSFVSSKHGNEQQPYRFSNGALVFVKVYWSTIVEG
uniref:DUF6598 domain-containing protein n=1 Tax=Triticum aestivum TaxID=4565 RepID=A0A077RZ17_WHEAT|nr:unnamed protein product [Triticum aestivum]